MAAAVTAAAVAEWASLLQVQLELPRKLMGGRGQQEWRPVQELGAEQRLQPHQQGWGWAMALDLQRC